MRRFHALLLVAGLTAAPVMAAAEPCTDHAMLHELEWTSSSAKGRLGVQVMTLTPELRQHFGAASDRGVLVSHVEPLSPAALAGIRPGDVLTQVRGRTVDDAADVLVAVADAGKDKPIAIDLVRDGRPVHLSARLTSDPLGWLDPAWTMGWLHELLRPFAHSEQHASIAGT